jgi:myb proto-oncogene protein
MLTYTGRTIKQIRDHYENNLKPDVNRNEWTLEEDLLLIDLVNKFGRNWKEIEDRLRGRSRNQIKNRFFGKICRLNSKKKMQMENAIQPSHGNITNFAA